MRLFVLGLGNMHSDVLRTSGPGGTDDTATGPATTRSKEQRRRLGLRLLRLRLLLR